MFLSKLSTLWPIDDGGRVHPVMTDPPPKTGHVDIIQPSSEHLEKTKVSSRVFKEDVQNKLSTVQECGCG